MRAASLCRLSVLMAILRRLLLAAGRARAVRASARARLVRSNEYCRPAASRLPDGSTRLAMRAPAALAAAPAAAALAAAALAGKRYDRRRPLHPRLPSRAPSRRARPTLLAQSRHASSLSRGEQAVQRAKRARSRTFKAGSGHSKGIPLRIPSVPPSS